ncbi:MAG: putative TIM-barrel fold metal-dependent hydrolase [Clostridia bacterium]|nr:putative TIM-barrel fold metal-dependent hydrolase [Clostridia bacterium]
MNIQQALYNQISRMPVIDTHEHLPHSMSAILPEEKDVLNRWLTHYLNSDLVSAGLNLKALNKARDPTIPVEERWALVEPFWEICRFTGYGQAVSVTARELYGIDEVNGDTIAELAVKHKASYDRDFMFELLHDTLHIEKALLDGFTGTVFDKDERIFARVWRPEYFIGTYGVDKKTVEMFEKDFCPLKSFDDWILIYKVTFDRIAPHISALKIGLAYSRSIYFPQTDYAAAKEAFDKVLVLWNNSGREGKMILPESVQNYMMHYILKCNKQRRLPVQIHTGLQEGNGNTLENSNPLHLNNLFIEYPDIPFDLFHIGWPFTSEALALTKMHPNVTLDFCWTNIISPHASVRVLCEAMDTVPLNKISVFGGDYIIIDLIYGHLEIAKQNLSNALSIQVGNGVMTLSQAEKAAHMMLYDNPKRIFNLLL